jgi:hypothetical protein
MKGDFVMSFNLDVIAEEEYNRAYYEEAKYEQQLAYELALEYGEDCEQEFEEWHERVYDRER